MQNHDKRARLLKVSGHERKHPKTARIRSESLCLNQWAAIAGPAAALKVRESIESVQLRQTSQEFDIFDERHRQLRRQREIGQPHLEQIVAAAQNKKAVRCQSPELSQKLICCLN